MALVDHSMAFLIVDPDLVGRSLRPIELKQRNDRYGMILWQSGEVDMSKYPLTLMKFIRQGDYRRYRQLRLTG